MIKVELLAPAKNAEYGIEAIKHGADAVFIAADLFGARQDASNPRESLIQLIEFAHKYRAKVYVVINTIIYDKEIEKVVELVEWAYKNSVDALIVQDMALLELDLPPIKLFASTQTYNKTPEKTKFLRDVGFQRVILERNISIEEIKRIRKEVPNIDIEAFVHGAICVSYSGQCYISESVCEDSANRGKCNQLCRWDFNLKNDKEILLKNRHLLSPKDMNLSEKLLELTRAGVTSFKIEGRLKDIDYLKNTVTHYHKELEKIVLDNNDIERASIGNSVARFEPSLDKSFSRGFTSYYFDGYRKGVSSFDTPKAVGELIGRVVDLGKNRDEVLIEMLLKGREDSEVVLTNGDGICSLNDKDVLIGGYINAIYEKKVFKDGLKRGRTLALTLSGDVNFKVGEKVYRNHNHKFSKAMKIETATRRIPVKIMVEIDNREVRIEAVVKKDTLRENSNLDNIVASVLITNNFEVATNSERMLETLKTQMAKNSNEFFEVVEVKMVEVKSIPFIPVGEINSFRRELLEKLEKTLLKSYKIEEFKIVSNDTPYPMSEINVGKGKTDIDFRKLNIANKHAWAFYQKHKTFEIDKTYSGMSSLKSVELTGNFKDMELMRTSYCIRREIGACLMKKEDRTVDGPLYIEKDNLKFRLEFDCKKCEMIILR